jgi:competence protein ComEC
VDNYVYFFDVGQGDSILISLNNKYYMIDTGGKVGSTYSIADNILIPVLKSLGITKLDYLILSHGDYDHMGESINLINNFNVDKIVFNCGEINDLEKELYNNKSYKCIKSIDNKLYFLQTSVYDDENENSNVIYMNINNYSFLFMGDAGYVKEKDIIDKYNIHDIDVLKVGHHGSNTSASKEVIDIINPKYSVISVGLNNKFKHPNKEVLNNLDNSKIYRTDEDGSIMFKIKNNKLKIETCEP